MQQWCTCNRGLVLLNCGKPARRTVSTISVRTWRRWETATEIDLGGAVEREALIRSLDDDEKLTKQQLEWALLRLGVSRSPLYKLRLLPCSD
jgi:hypothetical protein